MQSAGWLRRWSHIPKPPEHACPISLSRAPQTDWCYLQGWKLRGGAVIDLPIVLDDACPRDDAEHHGGDELPDGNSYLDNQALIDVAWQIGEITSEFCGEPGAGDGGEKREIHGTKIQDKKVRYRRWWKGAQVNITSWAAGLQLFKGDADADFYKS